MKNTKKLSKFKGNHVAHSFSGAKLTQYSGLSPIMKYLNNNRLGKELNELFPTVMHNASKYSIAQILLSVVLASLAGVHRLHRIAHFTRDVLVLHLLGLRTGLNKDVISVRLKELGQSGAIRLQEYLYQWQKRWTGKHLSDSIILDADSTVQTVYGHQTGAAKGYNTVKKGANSYHPILVFVSGAKIVLNSWFRTGSAYTSNGICDFMKQTAALIPAQVKQILFRADSGFFNGNLFDLLESYGWNYLVKVKLKNLNTILPQQQWQVVVGKPEMAISEFEYQGNGWKKPRRLKGIRVISEWLELDYFGQKQRVAQYKYACYCSNLEEDAIGLQEKYKERAISETWIEEVKSQLLAGKNITDDFHANDILWQLQVLAYNLSVMIRYQEKRYWRQEHKTFRDWFIIVPAKFVYGGHQVVLKIYEHYYYKIRWKAFDDLISA